MEEQQKEAREDHHVAIAKIQKDVEYLRENVGRISVDFQKHADNITSKLDLFTASFITRQAYDDREKAQIERSDIAHDEIRGRIRSIERVGWGIGAWVLYQIGEAIVNYLR